MISRKLAVIALLSVPALGLLSFSSFSEANPPPDKCQQRWFPVLEHCLATCGGSYIAKMGCEQSYQISMQSCEGSASISNSIFAKD